MPLKGSKISTEIGYELFILVFKLTQALFFIRNNYGVYMPFKNKQDSKTIANKANLHF